MTFITDHILKTAALIRQHYPAGEKISFVKFWDFDGIKVFVLAGFGNSYSTDGNFLSYISEIKLPAGKPIAVMINGGEAPPEYREKFLTVSQNKIIKSNWKGMPRFQPQNTILFLPSKRPAA